MSLLASAVGIGYGLIQAFNLDSLWAITIEVSLFAFRPLLLATASTVKPFGELVLSSPVVGYHAACYSVGHRFGEWPVAVSSPRQGKLQHDTMSDVPPILCGHSVFKPLGGAKPLCPFAVKSVIG